MKDAEAASAPISAARPLRIAAVGHSHLAAIIRGYREIREANGDAVVHARFIQLNHADFRPALKEGKLNPAVADAIENADADMLLSCIAGNAHNVLGLLNHPTRFDFVLPEAPHLWLDEAADILPFGVIEGSLRQSLQPNAFRLLTALRDSCRLPIFHLESPPPIPSADFISQIPETVFRDRIGELGVAPASLRYKLWRLHSGLVQQFCAAAGIVYVPVPQAVLDENGMLAESCWGNATHGNEKFGLALLRAAIEKMQGRGGEQA